MTSRDFCYWLQGFFELQGTQALTVEQARIIQNHLNMVFVHEIDPSFPKDQQSALQQAHDNKKPQPVPFDPHQPFRC